MTVNKVCLNCGSSAFVSDRSLGGKIVCSRCGASTFTKKSSSIFNRKEIIFLAIGVTIFIIVLII